jgi:hypothetical protein
VTVEKDVVNRFLPIPQAAIYTTFLAPLNQTGNTLEFITKDLPKKKKLIFKGTLHF